MSNNTSKDWWSIVTDLSKTVSYGELKQAIERIPELSILNDEHRLIPFLKENPDAWNIYRTWLKINETDKPHIRKNKKLLSALLDEPITKDNIEIVGPTISRIGNIPIWTHEHLEKLNSTIKTTNLDDWFKWDMVHSQNDSSSRYPWNVILTNWCYQAQNKTDTITKVQLDDLISKSWPNKARCLIVSTILKTPEFKAYYSIEDQFELATQASPETVKLGKELFDNTEECLTLIADTLFNKTMSIQQKMTEQKNNKLGKEILDNIEFTFDWN